MLFVEATLCKALHPKPTDGDDKDEDPPGNLDIIASGLEKPLGCARCFDGRGNVHHP